MRNVISLLSERWWQLLVRPDGRMNVVQIVLWWEARRFAYNIIVGTVGLFSLLLFFIFIGLSGTLQPGEDAVEPMAVFVAPILVNICYTAGWVVEIALRILRLDRPGVGPQLFAAGTILSLFIVLLPSTLSGMGLILGILHISR